MHISCSNLKPDHKSKTASVYFYIHEICKSKGTLTISEWQRHMNEVLSTGVEIYLQLTFNHHYLHNFIVFLQLITKNKKRSFYGLYYILCWYILFLHSMPILKSMTNNCNKWSWHRLMNFIYVKWQYHPREQLHIFCMVWRAAQIAPIFQVIYISIGHYTSIDLHSVPSCQLDFSLSRLSGCFLIEISL